MANGRAHITVEDSNVLGVAQISRLLPKHYYGGYIPRLQSDDVQVKEEEKMEMAFRTDSNKY
ncbi:hypothetical protein CCR75_001590 [Bremia lactucae]|uniref:Uncharacterized protein n=1 Tax=Bremia lactucae TaxID=4779 RepID=A0A976FIJ7_BRELC|nr:hypothetical protein CCR75_001590 [Bremia lactucae]